jgi:hypothetical protein
VPDDLVPDDAAELRAANAGLRTVVEARNAEIAGLRAELDAERRLRERRKGRKRGGQPGHPGKGLARDPDPGEKKDAPPAAECRSC